MKTETLNAELWAYKNGEIVYAEDNRTMINPFHLENAELIIASVNACNTINPANPLNVAKALPALFNALDDLKNNWNDDRYVPDGIMQRVVNLLNAYTKEL